MGQNRDAPSAQEALDPVDVHVGLRVRGRRIVMGLSQTATATALGVTFQQVQKYEKGVNRIAPSRLAMLSGLLGVPVPFFFEGTPGSREETSAVNLATQLSLSRTGVRLAKAFGAISDARVRAKIVALVQDLAEGRGQSLNRVSQLEFGSDSRVKAQARR